MSRTLAQVVPGTFTFYQWIQQTNALLSMAAETVTINGTPAGDMTTGNGFVTGILGANTITATNIRGGNVQSTSAVNFISNTNFGNSSVSVYATHNAVDQYFAGIYTSTTISSQAIDTFPLASYRSGKYLISVTSGTSYQVTEIMIIHDGTNVYTTEYATLLSGSTLAQFSADISSPNVRLNVVPTNASTTFKFQRTLLAV